MRGAYIAEEISRHPVKPVTRLERGFVARLGGHALRHHHDDVRRWCCHQGIVSQAAGIAEMILELHHGFTRPEWKSECIVIVVRQRDRESLHRRLSGSQSL